MKQNKIHQEEYCEKRTQTSNNYRLEIRKVCNKEKVLQRWSEYYEKHFELQEAMDNSSGEEWTMYVKTAEPYVEPPHYVDTDMAISKLKNVKTTGHDEIPVEFIRGRKRAQGHLFSNSICHGTEKGNME